MKWAKLTKENVIELKESFKFLTPEANHDDFLLC
jgi:hypothetical protein